MAVLVRIVFLINFSEIHRIEKWKYRIWAHQSEFRGWIALLCNQIWDVLVELLKTILFSMYGSTPTWWLYPYGCSDTAEVKALCNSWCRVWSPFCRQAFKLSLRSRFKGHYFTAGVTHNLQTDKWFLSRLRPFQWCIWFGPITEF